MPDWKKKGNAFLAEGKLDEAVDCYRQAIQADPSDAYAYLNLGYGLNELGQHEQAAEALHASIALADDIFDSHYMLGQALASIDRFNEATESFRTAVSLKPDFEIGLYDLGRALERVNNTTGALDVYRRALLIKPDFAEAILQLTRLLLRNEEWGEALIWTERLLQIEPASETANALRAQALFGCGRHEDALRAAEELIHKQPGDAQGLYVKGNALFALNRYEESARTYEQALDHHPDKAMILTNCGASYQRLGRLDAAAANFKQALRLKSDYYEAIYNLGVTLMEQGMVWESLQVSNEGLKLHPNNPDLHWNRSIAHLLLGNFEAGWVDYEWRWKAKFLTSLPRKTFDQPVWTGEQSLQGRSILLSHEQGLGDSIQFVRYAPILIARGAAQVYVEVPSSLRSVLEGFADGCKILSDGDPLPRFDFYCPMMSVPTAVGTTLHTVPASVPYLHSQADLRAYWVKRLGTHTRLRIGLVWSGNVNHRNDRNRSIPIASILKEISPNYQLVCLQKDIRDYDRQTLDQRQDVLDVSGELHTFAETAALIDCMDLVISVDTSVAHLAGALGKPLWLLLPQHVDWRWMIDREDSPWYPTARLFRQRAYGDWPEVLRRVAAELSTFPFTPA